MEIISQPKAKETEGLAVVLNPEAIHMAIMLMTHDVKWHWVDLDLFLHNKSPRSPALTHKAQAHRHRIALFEN